jgi:hypothetical protein
MLNVFNEIALVHVDVLPIIREIRMKAVAQNVFSAQIAHRTRHVFVINVKIHAQVFAV